MATIHQTTLAPTKIELLTAWLPTRPWYRGADTPDLTKAGGFRLDDPTGEVGIEFMVVRDVSDGTPVHYLVPLSYRGAPLSGADDALIGTAEHGVLGTRWIYDGVHDMVLVSELVALLGGKAVPQAQSQSDTVDTTVRAGLDGAHGPLAALLDVSDDSQASDIRILMSHAGDLTLRVHRRLAADDDGAERAGQVSAPWLLPDGDRPRGVFVSAHRVSG